MKGDDFGEETPEDLAARASAEPPETKGRENFERGNAGTLEGTTLDADLLEVEPLDEPLNEDPLPDDLFDDEGAEVLDSAGGESAVDTAPVHRFSPRPQQQRGSRRAAPAPADTDEDASDEDGFTHEGEDFEQDDPLAPGFDIEKGTPLGSQRGESELPVRTKIRNAKEFFNQEILYRFDILEDDTRTELAGNYRIELKGFQGGVWTITVGNNLDVVNRKEDAEIVFTLQQRDFLQLVNGQLNPQLAMFAQKMRVQGDLRKAVAFQAILVPSVD